VQWRETWIRNILWILLKHSSIIKLNAQALVRILFVFNIILPYWKILIQILRQSAVQDVVGTPTTWLREIIICLRMFKFLRTDSHRSLHIGIFIDLTRSYHILFCRTPYWHALATNDNIIYSTYVDVIL